jgi:MFS family permease
MADNGVHADDGSGHSDNWFLLQRVSTRTVFMLAMGLFSAGTFLAAISPGFWMLLPARIVQASGTAVMIPLLMTTVLTLVPVERRGVVMGNLSIAISVAPAIGPTLSGLVLQFLSWRFMFVLVLPIALATLVYGSRRLVNVGQAGHQSLTCALSCSPSSLRRPCVRAQPVGSGRLRAGRCPRIHNLRIDLHADVRLAPATADPGRRQPVA